MKQKLRGAVQAWPIGFLARAAVLTAIAAPGSAQAFTLAYSETVQGWNTTDLEVDVNYDNCPISPGALNLAIDTGMNLWNSVPTSSIQLHRGGQVTNSGNTGTSPPFIGCEVAFDTISNNQQNGVAALTFATPSNGTTLDHGYLLLNAYPGAAAEISVLSQTTLNVLLAHELGHLLGLGHAADTSALMYYNISLKTEVRLAQDDIDGITYLYPRQEIGQNGLFGCGSLALLRGPGSAGSSRGPLMRHSTRKTEHSPDAGIAELSIFLLICLGLTYALQGKWRVSPDLN